MLVFRAVVVMNMNGCDAVAERGDGFSGSDCDVCVAKIEADADAVEVSHFKNERKMGGSCGLAEQILNQEAYAQRPCKGAEVLERGLRELDGTWRPGIVSLAEMDDEIAQRDVLGGFQSTFDLIHGIDAAGLLGVQHIDAWSAGPAHFAIRK